MEKTSNSARLKELNAICMECIEKANRHYEVMDRRCCLACKIGIEMHRLECEEGDKWGKVDWNTAQFEEYYHN